MASVYILYSEKINRFYVGSCENIAERLIQHSNKIFKDSFTAVTNDWQLFLSLENIEYTTARAVEKHIKDMKSSVFIKNLKKYPELIEKIINRYSFTVSSR